MTSVRAGGRSLALAGARSPARAWRCVLALALLAARCDAPRVEAESSGADARWPELQAALLAASAGAPLWLSQTGLYDDIATQRFAGDLHEFRPRYALWSDGLEKRRWLHLPSGTQIDDRDADHWQLPVGALAFKEFSRNGQRLETRLIARLGPGERDYWMGAFVWNPEQSDALFAPEGRDNALGSGHRVPSVQNCGACHHGAPGRVLGLSAVQAPELPRGWLRMPQQEPFVPPGNDTTRAALGYLHANCAHCHNPRGSARPDADLDLQLSVSDRTPEQTRAYQTAVGKPLQRFRAPGQRSRVARREPDASALLGRMSQRGDSAQMPPLGSGAVDLAGVALVRAWIESL
ncbi:MAG TPA: hypothetical protein VNN80_04035 [Polyangiaceae bacterium]|nr:hypothetical protein [Polyangiaceae bacterium]